VSLVFNRSTKRYILVRRAQQRTHHFAGVWNRTIRARPNRYSDNNIMNHSVVRNVVGEVPRPVASVYKTHCEMSDSWAGGHRIVTTVAPRDSGRSLLLQGLGGPGAGVRQLRLFENPSGLQNFSPVIKNPSARDERGIIRRRLRTTYLTFNPRPCSWPVK